MKPTYEELEARINDLELELSGLKSDKENYQRDFLFLHSILESPIDIIIFALDRNYCYTAFTKCHKETIKTIWGVEIQIGANLLDIISNPEDRQKARQNFDRAFQGEYFVLTEEYGNKTLLRTYYENYYSSVKNSEGQIIGVSVFVIDITQRKQVEMELKESQLLLLSSIESQKDTQILSVDRNYQYLFFNTTHREVMKYRYLQEIKSGMNILECITSDFDRKESKEYFDRAFMGESHTNVTKSGGNMLTYYENFFNPIVNDKNEIIGATVLAKNITNRVCEEEILRKREQEFSTLVENSPDMIVRYDTNFKFIYCNSAIVQQFGDPIPSYFGKTPLEVGHPLEEAEFIINSLKKAIRCGKTIEVEQSVKTPTQQKYFITQIVPERNEKNEIETLLTITRDMTQRKQAEDLLQQTRQNYEIFFNTIDELLFVLDIQGNIMHANATVIKRLGYSKAELYGKSVLMLHPPERRDEAGRIVGEMLCGMAEFCPVPVITKSGMQIPVETRIAHGLWDGKAVIFGVSKDITKIKFSEEKFSKLFHINPSACGLSSLDDNKYIEVNEVFYTLLGFEKNEVIGKTASELGILTNEAKNVILQKADSNGNISNVEADLKARNGDIKHVLLSAASIYVQDKKYRFTVVHDITEHKKAEKELIKLNNQLKDLVVTKDRFISVLAHDLKGPFNILLGFSELLKINIRIYDLDKIEKQVNCIYKTANQTYNLLEDILMWARSQSGKFPFEPQNLSFSDLCIEIMENLKLMADAKNITINLYSPPEMIIFADLDMLKIILRNLISNAIKFTCLGGKIDIYAEKKQTTILITISDNGVGIAPEILIKLFKISQIHTSKGTANEIGTGLGLLLCKEFVEKHGGKIWVESQVGKGSDFKFSIPLVTI